MAAGLLFGLQALNAFCHAEEIPAESSINDLLVTFPTYKSGTYQGLVINSFNAGKYQSLIIPELRPWLRSGELQLEAFAKLDYELKTGLSFANDPSKPELNEQNLLNEIPQSVSGPFFALQTNPKVKQAIQTLWNVIARRWSSPYITSNLAIQFVRNENAFRTLYANFKQVYPASIREGDTTGQLLRNRLSFTGPATVNSFSFLTFRFLDGSSDVLFMYSPVTRKTRQLTSSNRTDALLGTSIALDDLLVWSGNIADLEVTTVETGKYLVPFLPLKEPGVRFRKDNNCETYSQVKQDSVWNYQSEVFVQAASWIPTNAAYIPRDLLRLTLTPRDPYSTYGRQVLYIDPELALPIFKIVYDNSGSLLKTIIGVYGVSPSDSAQHSVSIAQQVILDSATSQQCLIEYREFSQCNAGVGAAVLDDFAPQKMDPAVEAAQ